MGGSVCNGVDGRDSSAASIHLLDIIFVVYSIYTFK